MHRVSVLNTLSGCILFDNIWHWKEDQHKPSSAASLNHFFHQLALTVDEGIVSRVVFEQNAIKRNEEKNSTIFARHRMHNDRRNRVLKGRDKIEMFAVSNEDITVCLYVDGNFAQAMNPKQVAQLCADVFLEKYKTILDELKDKFIELNAMKEPNDARGYTGLMNEFKEFKTIFMETPLLAESIDARARLTPEHTSRVISDSLSSNGDSIYRKASSIISSSRIIEATTTSEDINGENPVIKRTSISYLLDNLEMEELQLNLLGDECT